MFYNIIILGVDIMTRYYCSGFDINNAFGHGLGNMFLNELKNTKSIYIFLVVQIKCKRLEKNTYQHLPNILKM